jgi:hypothetical protein
VPVYLTCSTPFVLIASNGGKKLRFLSPSQLAPNGDRLYDLISSGDWVDLPVWESKYAPGGERSVPFDLLILDLVHFPLLKVQLTIAERGSSILTSLYPSKSLSEHQKSQASSGSSFPAQRRKDC